MSFTPDRPVTAGPGATGGEQAARDLIAGFYAALGRGDHATMAAAYAPAAHFRDPAFGDLTGPRIAAMWRMLTESATDLEVTVRDVTARGDRAAATWVATYTFSQTGRRVVNVVDARFRLVDGRITDHVDQFDFWTWSRQALGPIGLLLGWNPLLRMATTRKANGRLEAYIARNRIPV